MNYRQRRAARLRAKADALDPGGAFVRLAFEDDLPISVTWESCCRVPFLNTTGTGTPVYHRVDERHRMTDETTVITEEGHH